ncbi:MAG: hypothetical protein RLZZ221_2605 [Verrucomicrobiota bacterium]
MVRALHGLMPALLTEMRLEELGGASTSGRVTPPEYWLKLGRPIEVYQEARAMRFSRRSPAEVLLFHAGAAVDEREPRDAERIRGDGRGTAGRGEDDLAGGVALVIAGRVV